MAELGGTFNPADVKDERELLPSGEALAQIFESDLVANKAGTGQLAKFGWEIISGPLQGRKLWTQENVAHQNAQAQEIGQRNLKRICEAAGVGAIRNTDELHFKPMLITIGVEKPQPGYDPKNDIKGYKFYGPQDRAAPSAPSNPPPQQQTQAKTNSPWPSRT